MNVVDRLRHWFGEDAPSKPQTLGLVLSGGGARGAYQAGVLQFVAERHPDLWPPIMTGVSAGAINVVHLAASGAPTLKEAVIQLADLWHQVTPAEVYESDSSLGIFWKLLRGAPGSDSVEELELTGRLHGLVNTNPLRRFLETHLPETDETGSILGIQDNLRNGRLKALAVMTANYTTGQTNAWVQGGDINTWDRPMRRSIHTRITVEHIMASAALPLFFPAIRLGDTWHGDGGIRLTAPLAPALHLGADRILVISTRHQDSPAEASDHEFQGYPPTAQIIGLLMNAVFLDLLDQDLLTLQRINDLVDKLPPRRRAGLRRVEALVLRPSVNLAELARDFQTDVAASFRLFMRVIGSDRTRVPRWYSMLNFEPAYIDRIFECGYKDALERADALDAFLSGELVEAVEG